MRSGAKDVRLDPLNGFLDTRSPSGSLGSTSFRFALNVDGSEAMSYCRLGGWRRYRYEDECYLNQDLHDQLLCGQVYGVPYNITTPGSRELMGVLYNDCTTEVIPGYTDVEQIGTFCGYAPESGYPLFSTTLSPFVCVRQDGYPYEIRKSPCTDGTNKVTWNLEIQSNAASWEAEEITATASWQSETYGPGSETKSEPDGEPDVQTITLNFCIPADATDVQITDIKGAVISGPFNSGVECEPAPEDCDCTTGEPFYYALSSYSICRATVFEEQVIVVCDSAGTPVYKFTPQQVEEFCAGQYRLGRQCREHVTMLHSLRSVEGSSTLIAATMSRIYANNERGGNWRMIADGLGGNCHSIEDCLCSPKRFQAAQLGNVVIFTNGIDPVLAWTNDDGPDGCFSWSADYMTDLLLLNITSAGTCGAYQGFLFLGDVVADNQRMSSRIHWCDYNNPYHWAPGFESIAGFHDFGRGETVVSIMPIGGKIRVYTDRAVYDGYIVQDERVFAFEEVYRGQRVPVFKYAVVNCGDFHMFLGEDSLFRMAEYDREPTPFEWQHLAVGAIFRGVKSEWLRGTDLIEYAALNKANCNNVVGGWDATNEALWFSWPTGNNQCPNQSIVLWPKRRKASLVDHGFTAFTNHQPDNALTVRDFLAAYGLCDPTESRQDKEGVQCDISYEEGSFTGIWNATEDPSLPMDQNSFLAQLCDVCLEDLCLSCLTPTRFLMASAEDKTIKEFTRQEYVREMLVEQTLATCPPLNGGYDPYPEPEPEPEPPSIVYDPDDPGGDPVQSDPCSGTTFVWGSSWVWGFLPETDPNGELSQSEINCHIALFNSEVQSIWPGATIVSEYKWLYVGATENKLMAVEKIQNGDCDATSGMNDTFSSFGGYVTVSAVVCLP